MNSPDPALAQPFRLHRATVPAEWIDVNDHMNVERYYHVLYRAQVEVTEHLELGRNYVASRGLSKMVVESNFRFERELRLGEQVEVRSRLLGVDRKRIHFFHELWNLDRDMRAAVGEQIDVHVDLATRRSAPLPEDVLARLQRIVAAQAALPAVPARLTLAR
ncbi:thioesterase family protein [Solimonas sp. SE-A11]|uniref:thioesterase family protein n=1 Tax=Solimonas sp. SE-A11 TaxID=3054954 RepID=UPI00259CC1FA|nr:thioesterase family protein [Solimonas sp. SE-A11]MDM4772306.1 thioesterase family protein [Solimonas sp. SE-A11]